MESIFTSYMFILYLSKFRGLECGIRESNPPPRQEQDQREGSRGRSTHHWTLQPPAARNEIARAGPKLVLVLGILKLCWRWEEYEVTVRGHTLSSCPLGRVLLLISFLGL